MTGGSGADIFDLDFAGETGNTNLTRDIVTDFAHLVDDFDLSGMDASAVLAGNNAFGWRGTAAFTAGGQGQLRYQILNPAGTANDKTVVYGDTDNDTASEFQIELSGIVRLSGIDFIA